MSKKIKILLVEDHELTRKGIVYGINKSDKFEVVGEAEDGKEAIDFFKKMQPDVILMDIALPVINGIEATKIIKKYNPDVKIIMLTSYGDKDKVFGAFTVGANAYCMKDIKLPLLNKVIDIVTEGGVWLDPQIADIILNLLPIITLQAQKQTNKPKNSYDDIDLTAREKEILKLISQGLTNKDIAQELSLSIYTVKNHVSSIINKLSVDDRTQAAIVALKEDLIS